MNVPILDLKRQYQALKEELEPAVCSMMASGQYIMGQYVKSFEEKCAAYLGVKHAIATGNGTDSLVIALRAAKVGPGDEVITTPFTFFATAEAIASVGATPVFVDIKETDFNIDPQKIEEKITSKTKAILPVHIFGCPAEMDSIMEIAQRHHLVVIEDACQAIGADYKGKKVGSIGELGCFSFFPTKNLGGFGDGGMITTNDDSLALICRALREHAGGKTGLDAKNLLSGEQTDSEQNQPVDPLYNPYKYYNYLVAYNSRLDAIQAVVLSVKLDHLAAFNKMRETTAQYYNTHLDRNRFILPQAPGDCNVVWHQYAVRTKNKAGLGDFLAKKGVSSAAFYPVPLHLQKALTHLGYQEGSLPVAEMICSETVCLPIFPELSEAEREWIVECANQFC